VQRSTPKREGGRLRVEITGGRKGGAWKKKGEWGTHIGMGRKDFWAEVENKKNSRREQEKSGSRGSTWGHLGP